MMDRVWKVMGQLLSAFGARDQVDVVNIFQV